MNDLSYRLKKVMDGRSVRKFAGFLDMSPTTVQEYLKGRMPPADFIVRVSERCNVNALWLLTGAGPPEQNGAVLNQDAETNSGGIHIDVHQAAPIIKELPGQYSDPITDLFVKDWQQLSDVVKMRVWTLVKEELEKQGNGK